ncbi:hypothetical protein M413DRAFT_439860, partial [Hebeloma cylindrosporum]
MKSSKAVKLANKASSAQLAKVVSSSYELPSNRSCRVKVMHSSDLKRTQRESIWAVFEANMYEFYKSSSFGWDPEAKRKELFHSLSRFILVHEADTDTLLAFIMLRFELEEEEDVIYCYDIQVTKAAQGMGLGKELLSELAKIGNAYEMEKIMLTVLKANTKATAFYKAIGFELDPTSPEYKEDGEELDPELLGLDYEILSRSI